MNLNRRRFLASAGALSAAPGLVVAGQSGSTATKTATYVLVHGGGHGGWCWQRVAKRLRAGGHEVYTPTLTGLGERSHLARPDTDLDTHITDVVNVMKFEDLTGVILVGHSYGGMVITGVADRALSRIAHLVFLDASHPQNGQSLASSAGKDFSDRWRRTARTVNGVEFTLNEVDAAQLERFGLSKPEDIAWATSKLTPHPLKSFTQPLHLANEAAVRKIPSTDINRKGTKPGGSAQTRSDRLWEIDDPGHDLMITSPQVLAEMLMKLAVL